MEFCPDSITYSDLGFIAQHKKVFSPEEVVFPDDKCNTVAVAPRYGLVFCSNNSIIKVFQTKDLSSDGEPPILATIDAGCPVTYLSTSCDGLTLLAVVLVDDKPRALFYEIRYLVPGCENLSPFAATGLKGARVQAVAWNPMDPNSVAVAVTPDELCVVSLKEDKVETKSRLIKARALSWSPKGKQLTAGLADGSLALFKPDLQLVRTVKNPPMEEASAVQSVTWFTNTEFFIGYRVESEEGGQVMMYVNAPKAQEPKYVLYEFICSENAGPRPAAFYQAFFPEWSILCLASSRAFQLGVLGKAQGGSEGWCEFELEEGRNADMHGINITETTYPMGLAVDFTSQKTFTNKVDGKVSGPCPVLYVMSTGGELNMFHLVNSVQGVDPLVAPAETLPKMGHRTAEQYGGSAAVPLSVPKPAAASPAPLAPKTTFMSPSPGMSILGGKADAPKPISLSTESSSNSFGSSFFGGAAQPKPLLPKFTTQAPLATSIGGGMTLGKSSPIQFGSAAATTTAVAPVPFAQQTPDEKDQQTLKASLVAGTDGKLGGGTSVISTPAISTPVKSQTPSPIPSSPLPRAVESQTGSKSPSPLTTAGITPVPSKEKDSGDKALLSVISAVVAQFQLEIQAHSDKETDFQIGSSEEMADIRRSLVEETSWIEQMSSTTSELFGEITQLHYEVLQGFKLREEADTQIAKSKNPRHFSSMQSRQLDPHSRRTLDDIRVKYQYLQSQLEEVNTKLHLDWINYTNAMKSRKKRDLPVSETVYNALMKCHTLRTRQERELELICDRLKALEVDSLSRGLRVNRSHNNDDVITNLEKSLSEVKVSPSAYVSPVKMLSQGKQEKLQKILAQRSTIPVRKCSSSPKSPLTSLLSNADASLHQNKVQDNSISFPGHTSFSLNTEASFGPQTFSTPQRSNKVSLGVADALSAPGGKSNNFLSVTQKKADPVKSADVSAAANGLSLTAKSVNSASIASKEVATGIGSLSVIKPVYEDITPPQTPDNKAEVEVKSASPLLALSSLVSKVPTTTAIETAATVTPATDAKLSFGEGANFSGLGTSSGPISFSFKPPQSLAATEISAPKPSLSLTTTEISSTLHTKVENSKLLPQFTTSNFSLGSVSVASSQGASGGASLTGSSLGGVPTTSLTSSSMFSFKGATPSSSMGGGLFTLKLPSVSSSFSPGITSTTGATSIKSSFTAVSSTGTTSIFGGLTSGQLSIGTISTPSPVVTTTTASPPSTQIVTSTTLSESKVLQSDSVTSVLKVSENDSEEASVASTAVDSTSEVTNTGVKETSEAGSIGSVDSLVISKLISSSTAVSPVGLFSSVKSSEEAEKPASSESSGSNLFSSVFSPSGSASTGTLFQGAGTSGGMFGVKSPSSSSVFGITTASSSMFKSPETTSSGSIFGGGTSATTGSLFGPPKTTESGGGSIFGTAKTTESGGGPFGTVKATESGSIFGTAKPAESGSLFSVAKTTESGGLFGTALPSSSSGSIFGGTAALSTGNSLASKPATPMKSTAAETLPSSTTATTSADGSVATVSSPSSGGNLFGGISTPASASGGSVFGGALSTTTTTTGSLFSSSGTLSASTTSTSSVFGSSSTTTATSLFGTSSTTITTSPFGTPSTTTTASPFGTSGTTTAGSTFGSSGTSSSGSTFGQSSAFGSLSTSSSAFGTLSTTTTFSGGGMTLNAASTTTSSGGGASLFGQAQQKSDSIFGQTPQTSTPSLFGGQTAATGSVFGGATQSQGTTSVFGSAVSQSGSIFGGTSTQPSGTSIFGQSATSSTVTSGNGIGFGQPAPAVASPFASASTTSQQEGSSPFSSSGFGMGTSSSGGGFFSGLGNKPSEENANKNIFGSTSFSSAKPQLSLFGGSSQGNTSSFGAVATSTSSFGTGQTGTGSTFGSPGFGGPANTGAASGEASQSAFGMTASPKPSGFGNNTAFGGSPVFGGAASFGSPPKFGSSPSFGSPPAFGSMGSSSSGFGGFASAGTSTFGSVASSTPSSGGFGGFSGQNSGATFGSVAQQSPGQQQQQQQQQSTFGSSGGSMFSGGSSFSTWR